MRILPFVLMLGLAAERGVPPVLAESWLPCTDSGCLTLLSWNVHGLPWPFSRDPAGRLDAIATVIRSHGPDVVVLQEVWLNRYVERLDRALGADYQAYFVPRERWISGPAGGLVVFIRRAAQWRVPANGLRFVQYEGKAKGHLLEGDSISGKGVLRVDLNTGAGSLCILATHLQSQYPESGPDHLYVAERRGQLKELGVVAATCATLPTLILGDFNTEPDEHELYDVLMTPLGVDLTAHARAQCEPSCGSHFQADGTKSGWIDYIFSPTAGVEAKVERIANVAVDRPYSDHDGLLARIVFPVTAGKSR